MRNWQGATSGKKLGANNFAGCAMPAGFPTIFLMAFAIAGCKIASKSIKINVFNQGFLVAVVLVPRNWLIGAVCSA